MNSVSYMEERRIGEGASRIGGDLCVNTPVRGALYASKAGDLKISLLIATSDKK